MKKGDRITPIVKTGYTTEGRDYTAIEYRDSHVTIVDDAGGIHGYSPAETYFKLSGEVAQPAPLEPLSELHKDEEACRRVRDLITGPSASIEYWEGRTSFGGSADDAEIHDNGEFTDEVFGRRVNIFALVDLIRELGYGPIKKEVSEIKQSLTEAEKNQPLADRNPKRVLGVKKMWKANRHRRTL